MLYLVFEESLQPPSAKTKRWLVLNHDKTILGTIKWWTYWRKYCYITPAGEVVLDVGCLREIADFCAKQTREHKSKLEYREE
jgi:hypothetical protein